MEAVDREIAAIHGENFAEAFPLRDAEQGCIGEVHGTVGVFLHKFADARSVPGVKREELQGATFQHFPECFLCCGEIGEQVHGFGQRGPHGGHRLAEILERANTPGVMLVIGID
jgi:hypothetical protein